MHLSGDAMAVLQNLISHRKVASNVLFFLNYFTGIFYKDKRWYKKHNARKYSLILMLMLMLI